MLYVHVESSRPIEAHHQQPDYFLAQGPLAGDQILSMGARWNQSSTLNDLCTDKHHSKPSDYVHKINLLRLSSGCMGSRVNFDRQLGPCTARKPLCGEKNLPRASLMLTRTCNDFIALLSSALTLLILIRCLLMSFEL